MNGVGNFVDVGKGVDDALQRLGRLIELEMDIFRNIYVVNVCGRDIERL